MLRSVVAAAIVLLPPDAASGDLTRARITGMVFGILLAVTVWQSAVFWLARDLTLIPFLLAIVARAALEGVRAGLVSANLFGTPPMTVFVFDVTAGAAEVSFVVAFLELERPLTRRIVAATIMVFACALLTFSLTPAVQSSAESFWSAVRLFGAVLLGGAAVWRLRAGFKPAAFILVAIGGNLLSTLYLIALDRNGTLFPPLDPWVFQIGTAFPALVLALGIPFRARFMFGEREALERNLRAAEFAAQHDPLTGLLNRRGLAAWTAATTLAGGCILYIDLDGFKRVNDVAGHDAGDRTLIAVAGILSGAVRAGDAVARVGGDEFVVVLDPRSASRAADVAQRIADDVARLAPDGAGSHFGASIGKATFGIDGNFERTLAEADADAYRVKAERRARIQ